MAKKNNPDKNKGIYSKEQVKYLKNNPDSDWNLNRARGINKPIADIDRSLERKTFDTRTLRTGGLDMSEIDNYNTLSGEYLNAKQRVADSRSKLSAEEKEVMAKRKSLGNIASEYGDRGAVYNELGISEGLIKDIESRGGYTCNTYSGACMRKAGMTIPEGAEPLKIGRVTYGPGDKMPFIPGNPQFNSNAENLGWELQPKGTLPTESGDLIRGHMYKNAGGSNGDQHSVISAGDRDGDGLPDLYNNDGTPRHPYIRRTGNSDLNTGANNYYTKDSGVMRYVRNIPQYTNELNLSKEDAQKQKELLSKQPLPRIPTISAQTFANGGPLSGQFPNPWGMLTPPAPAQLPINTDGPQQQYAQRNEYMYGKGGPLKSGCGCGDKKGMGGSTGCGCGGGKNCGCGGKTLPKANFGAALGEFMGSEAGGQTMDAIGQLAPIVKGMFQGNNPQGQYPTPPSTYGMYAPQQQNTRQPGYGGYTFGGMSGAESQAMGMPQGQFANGGPLPQHKNGALLQGIGKGIQAVSPFISMAGGIIPGASLIGDIAGAAGTGLEIAGDMKANNVASESAEAPTFMQPQTGPQSMYAQNTQQGTGSNLSGYGPGQMSYGEMFAKGGVLPSHGLGDPITSNPITPAPATNTYPGADNWGEYQEYLKQMKAYETNQAQHARLGELGFTPYKQSSLQDYRTGTPSGRGNSANGLLDSSTVQGYNMPESYEGNLPTFAMESDANSNRAWFPFMNKPVGNWSVGQSPEEIEMAKAQAFQDKVSGMTKMLGHKGADGQLYGNYYTGGAGKNTTRIDDPNNTMEDFYTKYPGEIPKDTRVKAYGGPTQGQHPQSEYIAEKDEMVYHPNDKPVTLGNGGLNQVAEDFSKITGDKHSAPSGGVQMAGGNEGYIYSDQIAVPKDLYNSLKGLI
jgi:hypothetical protein